MTEAVLERGQAFLSQLDRVELPENEPAWMQKLRQEALESVRDRGLPTTELE